MSGMLFGERDLRAIAERAMRAAKGDQAEALIIGRTVSLTRYANSAIHQNVTSREAELRVRVVVGHRRATATTNRLDDEGIRRGQPVTLRWIYVHMVEEYARHNGHADLIRELVDGSVGW